MKSSASLLFLLFLFSLNFAVFPQVNRSSGVIEINGGKVYYEAAGRGRAVVFIHGGLVDNRSWDEQFKEFSKGNRVVRYDIRGRGKSPLPAEPYSLVNDVKELLRYLKIEKATVVGLSLGGVIAADFVLENPDMADALVLVGSGLRGYDSGKPDREGAVIFETAAKTTPEKAADLWLTHPHFAGARNRKKPRERLRGMLIDNFSGYTQKEAGKYYILPQTPTDERLNKIAVPTLVIAGSLDAEYILANANELKSKIAGSQLVFMKDASHHPNIEKPAEFNKILRIFLRKSIK